MATFRDPDLQHVLTLAGDFAVGKAKAARAYVQYHPGRIAIVVAGNAAGCSGAIAYRNLAPPPLIAAVPAQIIRSW